MPIFEMILDYHEKRIVQVKARSKSHAIEKIENDEKYDIIDFLNEDIEIDYTSVEKVEESS